MSATNITPFAFGENLVRAMNDENGDPWFVAKDVAIILGYRDAFNMVRMLDEDEKGTRLVSTPSGAQEMTVINESGLYAVTLRSERPEAKPFRKWVTADVLPTIRKTGSYTMLGYVPNPEPESLPVDHEEVTDAIMDMSEGFPSIRNRYVNMTVRLAESAGITSADDVYELSLACCKLLHTQESLTSLGKSCSLKPDLLHRIWREIRLCHQGSSKDQLLCFVEMCRVLEAFQHRQNERQGLEAAVSEAVTTYVARNGDASLRTFEITVSAR